MRASLIRRGGKQLWVRGKSISRFIQLVKSLKQAARRLLVSTWRLAVASKEIWDRDSTQDFRGRGIALCHLLRATIESLTRRAQPLKGHSNLSASRTWSNSSGEPLFSAESHGGKGHAGRLKSTKREISSEALS